MAIISDAQVDALREAVSRFTFRDWSLAICGDGKSGQISLLVGRPDAAGVTIFTHHPFPFVWRSSASGGPTTDDVEDFSRLLGFIQSTVMDLSLRDVERHLLIDGISVHDRELAVMSFINTMTEGEVGAMDRPEVADGGRCPCMDRPGVVLVCECVAPERCGCAPSDATVAQA